MTFVACFRGRDRRNTPCLPGGSNSHIPRPSQPRQPCLLHTQGQYILHPLLFCVLLFFGRFFFVGCKGLAFDKYKNQVGLQRIGCEMVYKYIIIRKYNSIWPCPHKISMTSMRFFKVRFFQERLYLFLSLLKTKILNV